LQLAGISLRGSAAPDELIQSFSGSHRYIIDYLAAEVLANQPDGLREFLCQTAMLDRFCADLCDRALGRSDSRTLLQRAETSNPFLVALDEQRHWYRYHHLLADVLQLEVEPALQAQIQQRAAVWFEQEGNFSEAVKYALRAKDYALSCNLIRKAAVPAAEQGMLATALGWLELLPEAVLLEATDLAILRAWFLVYNGRIPETIAWVARLEGLQTAHLPEDQQGMLLVLRSWLYMASGGQIDLDGLLRAQTMLGSAQPHFRPIVLLALGQAYESRGNTPAAMQCFEEAERLARQAGSLVTALILRNNLAFLLGRCGRRAEAAELYQEAIDEQTLPDGRPSLLAGIPMLVKGCMLYEDGNTEAAYPVLNQGLNLIRRLGMYDILASPVNYVLALLLQDEGRYEESSKRSREIGRQAQRGTACRCAARHCRCI
jgi:LuxR family maltose regulon positive regulatory protein